MSYIATAAAMALLFGSIAVGPRLGIADAETAGAPSLGAAEAPGVAPLAIVGQVGGNVMDAAVVRREAYLTVGPRLQVWDITDPAQPTLSSQSPAMDHMLGKVAVSEGRAFALETFFEEADEPTACHGIRVFDTASDHPPRPGGWLPCRARVNDMDAAGHHLVLATSDGVAVVEAADPGRPVVVGHLPGVLSARSIRLSGDLAYVAGEPEDTPDGSALLVYDALDLSDPSLIGRLDLTVRTAAIDVDRQLVFVVSRACSADVGLEVIDVSDPTAPRRVGFRQLTCGILDVAAGDGAAHVLGFDYETMIESVFVFDVTDPAVPQPAAVSPSALGRSLALADDHLLVAAGAAGTHVVDVDPMGEAHAVMRLPTLGDVADVGLDGQMAFATNSTGELWSVRVEIPSRPVVVGFAETGPGAGALVLHDGHTYVAQPDNTWSGRAGIHVMDVSRAAEPEAIGFVDISATSDEGELLASPAPEQMALDGERLYVPTGRYGSGPLPGFWRLDVSTAEAPEVSAFFAHSADVYGMSIVGSTAYLAAGDYGLDVVRVGDDDTTEMIGRVPTAGPAVHATVRESVLSVASDHGGVRLYDVLGAEMPVELGTVDGVTVTSTALAADRLLVPGRWGDVAGDAAGGSGLRVYDTADPAAPVEVASVALPAPGRVAVQDDLVAVAAGRLGLLLVTDRAVEESLFVPLCGR